MLVVTWELIVTFKNKLWSSNILLSSDPVCP